ncbi:MAG: hypothetical protein ABI696_15735 [Rubrivivax sp.]
MTDVTVRGACPHDCPDTCALLVTMQAVDALLEQGWRQLALPAEPFADGGCHDSVNPLTHRWLTELGRAPSFFDCMVEVAAELADPAARVDPAAGRAVAAA